MNQVCVRALQEEVPMMGTRDPRVRRDRRGDILVYIAKLDDHELFRVSVFYGSLIVKIRIC